MEAKNELQRNAIAEARRKELESYQRALDVQWLNSRMEDGRTGRCLALIEREAEMEKDFQEVEESQANRAMSSAIYNDLETTEQETREKMERNAQYSKELQQQLVSRQRERQCLYEDTLIEKKMQEGITRTMADEDLREVQYKHDQTEKMRNEMVTCQEARQAWKQKQKEMVVTEEREIEAQVQAAGDRSAAVVAERERKMHLREKQSEIMGEKLLADSTARQKREDIITLLQEQEFLEKNVQDDIAERVKMEKYRVENNEAVSAQLKYREGAARELAHQEAEFRREAEAQMATEDEIEREKERKKKEKNHQYFLDLQAQIADNARRRAADREQEAERDRQQFQHDEAWMSEVEEERKKIIEEHVPPLIGYLQAGVVQHDDLPAVRAGADRQDLAELDIESLAVSDSPQRFAKCNDQCKVIREY